MLRRGRPLEMEDIIRIEITVTRVDAMPCGMAEGRHVTCDPITVY